MRQLELKTVLNASAAGGFTSDSENMRNVEGFSVQINLSEDAVADFDVNIEGSNNDEDWLPIASLNPTSADPVVMTIQNVVPYAFMRIQALNAETGEQEITAVADVASSLNDTYFLLNSANGGVEYYVWYNVDGAGTDPALADKTGVEVAIAEDDTAADVAAATATAVDGLAEFAASDVGAVITVTNSAAGDFVPASDSLDAPTEFTFEVTAGGGSLEILYNSYGRHATQS